MARPKAQIDWNDVGQMLKCGCDTTSIATALGISTDTLYTRSKIDNKLDFSAFSQQKKAEGADLLRRKQFELALGGNVSMLIWLGKNRLGQAEKQEIKTQQLPASDSRKNDHLSPLIDHARRVYEVYTLEPLGMTFDSKNPEHQVGMKECLKQAIEGHKRMYPDDCKFLDDWEERSEKLSW